MTNTCIRINRKRPFFGTLLRSTCLTIKRVQPNPLGSISSRFVSPRSLPVYSPPPQERRFSFEPSLRCLGNRRWIRELAVCISTYHIPTNSPRYCTHFGEQFSERWNDIEVSICFCTWCVEGVHESQRQLCLQLQHTPARSADWAANGAVEAFWG